MQIEVLRTDFKEVEARRDLYRQEANCQIIRDSLLSRGLAEPYLLRVDGYFAGYGAIRNRYDPGRVSEFYTLPAWRNQMHTLFREFLLASKATEIESQTNIPWSLTLLYDFATNIQEESILFQDASVTNLTCPGVTFRRFTPGDNARTFAQGSEPTGDWLIEKDGTIVATGGYLCHYNPPYGDVYMEVAETARKQGIGSYLVQEVKRVCYEAGRKPAARCNPDNIASRRTLEKAGFLPCGRILTGTIDPEKLRASA